MSRDDALLSSVKSILKIWDNTYFKFQNNREGHFTIPPSGPVLIENIEDWRSLNENINELAMIVFDIERNKNNEPR